uniref:Nose resistant-to-fluoxetine protein N-terminal domain-containing protein n=1 Tax=Dendroctonus ponderosae TaxID=77166 RepID=A0AAR5Q395_DENPD
MKQGLIMNQILNTYGLSDVNNSLCRDHVNEFKLGLRAMEPWALKMFDASSKLMPGILAGNLAELGAWQQCLDINEETSFGPIKGRHCMLFIYPNEKLVKIILDFKKKISEKHFQNLKENILYDAKLMWSVCVPHSCTSEDVLRHFNKSIFDATEGLNVTISFRGRFARIHQRRLYLRMFRTIDYLRCADQHIN